MSNFEDQEIVVSLSSLPETLLCTISRCLMNDPVIDPTTLNEEAKAWLELSAEDRKKNSNSGNFKTVARYDRAGIKEWLMSNSTSPTTRQRLTVEELIPDLELKSQIDSCKPLFVEEIKEIKERQGLILDERIKYTQLCHLLFPKKKILFPEWVDPMLNLVLRNKESDLKDDIEKFKKNFTDPKQLSFLLSSVGTVKNNILKKSMTILQAAAALGAIDHASAADLNAALKNKEIQCEETDSARRKPDNELTLAEALNRFRVQFTEHIKSEEVFNPHHYLCTLKLANTDFSSECLKKTVWRVKVIEFVQGFVSTPYLHAFMKSYEANGTSIEAHQNIIKGFRNMMPKMDKPSICAIS